MSLTKSCERRTAGSYTRDWIRISDRGHTKQRVSLDSVTDDTTDEKTETTEDISSGQEVDSSGASNDNDISENIEKGAEDSSPVSQNSLDANGNAMPDSSVNTLPQISSNEHATGDTTSASPKNSDRSTSGSTSGVGNKSTSTSPLTTEGVAAASSTLHEDSADATLCHHHDEHEPLPEENLPQDRKSNPSLASEDKLPTATEVPHSGVKPSDEELLELEQTAHPSILIAHLQV